jgi:hypothetical protein
MLLERYIQNLLDWAQQDGVRGGIGAATVPRLIARELGDLLAAWREQQR